MYQAIEKTQNSATSQVTFGLPGIPFFNPLWTWIGRRDPWEESLP
ncbi:hypothetical protein ACVWXE_000518 [Thermostichus sp. MS-CIW-41]